jgi:hypothetical protein
MKYFYIEDVKNKLNEIYNKEILVNDIEEFSNIMFYFYKKFEYNSFKYEHMNELYDTYNLFLKCFDKIKKDHYNEVRQLFLNLINNNYMKIDDLNSFSDSNLINSIFYKDYIIKLCLINYTDISANTLIKRVSNLVNLKENKDILTDILLDFFNKNTYNSLKDKQKETEFLKIIDELDLDASSKRDLINNIFNNNNTNIRLSLKRFIDTELFNQYTSIARKNNLSLLINDNFIKSLDRQVIRDLTQSTYEQQRENINMGNSFSPKF